MISEKKERLPGSSGSSKTSRNREKIQFKLSSLEMIIVVQLLALSTIVLKGWTTTVKPCSYTVHSTVSFPSAGILCLFGSAGNSFNGFTVNDGSKKPSTLQCFNVAMSVNLATSANLSSSYCSCSSSLFSTWLVPAVFFNQNTCSRFRLEWISQD